MQKGNFELQIYIKIKKYTYEEWELSQNLHFVRRIASGTNVWRWGGVKLLVKISSSSPDSSGELLLCLFSSFGTKKNGGIRLPGSGGQYSISVVTEMEVVPVVLKASILMGPDVAVVGDYAGFALDGGGVVVGRPKRRGVRSRRCRSRGWGGCSRRRSTCRR